MSTFLAMGGYAAFVWPSYAVAAVVMGAIAAHAVRRARARHAELEALEARLGKRRERK